MTKIPHGEKIIEFLEVKSTHGKVGVDRDSLISSIPDDKLLHMYKNMVRTRCLDEKIKEMLNRGFSISEHSTLGQEAGPIGACAAIESDDYIMPYHRGWAWAIGKGMEPKYLLAELLGKKDGYCKGKGGPHLGCYELGILGRPGTQAAHIPIAAGVGLNILHQKKDRVCIAFFGNGASNNGNFHEGLNLASVWKVPVIFFCENNLYQIFCTAEETTSVEDIGDRAPGYNMAGYIIDGNDAVAVYHVTSKAVERARSGMGPTLIETKTYRWEGHNPIDKIHYGGYRSKEEVDYWRTRCPIKLMEQDLMRYGLLSDEDIRCIKDESIEEMNGAAEFAINSPYPDRDDYLSDVYVD